jgi:folate-binding protein YgfZ
MMTQWHEFLASNGALLTNGQVEHYGNPNGELQAAASGNVLADLSHLGLLQAEGVDAIPFLQGQLTNDINLLDGSNSQYAGYCNAKGRLLALFLTFAHHDHIHLQLDRALLEPMMKRLKMYVLRSKVVISDMSDSIMRMGVAGQEAEANLRQIFAKVPQAPYGFATLDNGAVLRLPGELPRYEVFSGLEHASAVWNALKPQHKPVGRAVWEWLEIKAGIPDIVPATQEEFVPQMVNLDALGGISFKKGCYTGQEIVARTHYLGKVKRRTQLAHIAATERPLPGDNLVNADGSEAGKIVRSAAAPTGGYNVLAELRLESLESGQPRWRDSLLEFKPLPYGLG